MNAKHELLDHLGDNLALKCARLMTGQDWDPSTHNIITLPVNYTAEEYDEFLTKLDFKYDSGYGSQQLHGTLWHTDNTWSERGEYDGSEWWEHRSYPEIPSHLTEK